MRGCIKKRSRDSWTVIVELPRDPKTQKRRQKWATVHGTKKDAERVLAELITEVDKGYECLAPAKMTVKEYLDQYLDTLKNNVRASTLKNYTMAFRAFNQYLGAQFFSKLTPLTVQKAVSQLLETRKQSTVREYLFRLKSAFKQAVAWGLIPKSPAEGVKAPKADQREMMVWTEDEANSFLKAAARHRYYALYVLALRTGARIGELLALRWGDVDLERGVVYITKSAGSGRDGSTKTVAGKRKVPVDGDTVRVLKEHHLRQAKEKLRSGSEYNPGDYIFCTTKGKRPTYEAMRGTFRKTVRKTGLPEVRFHELRHTHATILLRQGVNPKIVAERLGHKDVAVTLNIYSHVLPDTQLEAVRAMERVFGEHQGASR